MPMQPHRYELCKPLEPLSDTSLRCSDPMKISSSHFTNVYAHHCAGFGFNKRSVLEMAFLCRDQDLICRLKADNFAYDVQPPSVFLHKYLLSRVLPLGRAFRAQGSYICI